MYATIVKNQPNRDHLTLNIVIPVYNEEGSLPKLYEEIAAVAETLEGTQWQITFVEDGSTDSSLRVLHEMAATRAHVSVLALSRNFGKEVALSAGLDANEADVVLMMDSDLQHPPQHIPEFLAKWRAGAQVVVGVRSEEGTESLVKTYGSRLFYALINAVSQVRIVPRATDFRLLDREVVEVFKTMPEHKRITRGMIDWLGYTRDYVPFAAAERHAGEATYDTRKLFQLAFDSFVSMTMLPLRLSIYLGIGILSVFGPLGIFMMVSKYILNDRFDFSGPATLAVLIILLVGIILVNIGFVGLYIANIQEQVRGRPLYVVNKKYSKFYSEKESTQKSDVASVAEVLHTKTLPKAAVHSSTREHIGPDDIPLDHQKNIVWLSWKDVKHPQAGGAELVQHELCKRLVAGGHKVTIVTSRPKGSAPTEVIDGYTVDRKGSRYSVYWHVWRRYRKLYRSSADVVVEEVNTVGFFSRWYLGRGANRPQSILLFHQLAREIWFYEYFPPLNIIGYLIEPLSLRFIGARSKTGDKVIAMSNSTRLDLAKNGFDPKDIAIISEGTSIEPVVDPVGVDKLSVPSILAYGSIRSMKRTLHALQAFELAKKKIPNLVLTIAGGGSGTYASQVRTAVQTSPYAGDITLTGRVLEKDKAGLLGYHHFLVSTALKEGWGITITEAAAQGTPAIAYDVDGQRDAVFQGKAGVLVEPNVEALSKAIVESFAPGFDYERLQRDAWLHAQSVTFDNSYRDLLSVIDEKG